MNGHSSENRHHRQVKTHLSVQSPKKVSTQPTRDSKPSPKRHSRTQPTSLRTGLNSSVQPTHQLKPTPVEADADLRRKALREARLGHYDTAITLFSALIRRNPKNASDYNNRGLVYFQTAQLDQAIADYNRAIEINPSLDSVYNNRANYYACQGQLLSAILDYEIALELNPQNVRAWINQGITFRELKMYERAIECFDSALTFHRLEGHIYAERGRTYHVWGDWNMAIADYNKAIDYLPFSVESLHGSSGRLRLQVELWLDDLLSPLTDEL